MNAGNPEAIFQTMPPMFLAAAIINGSRQILDTHPDLAFRALRNFWTDISPRIRGAVEREPFSRFAVASLVLEAYFTTGGDWKRMERNMLEACEKTGAPAHIQSLVQKLGDDFARRCRSEAAKESA